MAILVLRSRTLLALVDPGHGGEVLDLIDLESGAGLLGRPPFAPLPPVTGDLDELAWTSSYRGGWQLVAPNAGSASDGHPFHGAASTDPWQVEHADEGGVRMRWKGNGLIAVRTLRLDDHGLEAEVEWRAAGPEPAPLVAVEHLTAGLALLDPELRLRLPGGRALELAEDAGDLAAAVPWPEFALLAGGRERADAWALADAGARFIVVTDIPEGRLDAVNVRSGLGLALEWDVAALPYLWLWREARASGGPWRGRGEIFGLEPASAPHGAGVAEAVRSGHAVWPTAERTFRHRMRANVVRSTPSMH